MKNKKVATILSFFLGGLGIHRFYLGQTILGVVYLVFCWTLIPSFIALIDFIAFLVMSEEKFNSKYNLKTQNETIKKSVTTNSSEVIQKNLISSATHNQEKQTETTQNRNFNYIPMQVQRQGLQVLESVNILNTTKNIDTLKGRYDFILTIYEYLITAKGNNRYISDIQISIDQFKTMYYDKIIKDFELNLIVQPNQYNLRDYYTICLFNCFNEFYKEQIIQIDALKKDDAKSRRKEKIIEVGEQTINEYKTRGSNKEQYVKLYDDLIKILTELGYNQNSKKSQEVQVKLIENPIIINPRSSFELTLYNSESKYIQQVVSILQNDTWQKVKDLFPLFSMYDIKCKEVDEYIAKYKPLYLANLKNKLENSPEFQTASEKDKELIENEVKEEVINSLPERASCDIITLFDYSDINCSIDNELVNKYGYSVISKYFGLSYYKNKVITHWERKDFEDLLKADLVKTVENISIEEILNSQTLKTLNLIADKEDGFFKRKNKAIEFILENNLNQNLGKHVATRNLFMLNDLPSEFQSENLETIECYWSFLHEYISLIADTYRDSARNKKDISEDISWVKSIRIETHEEMNSNFICLRAREECKKKYSKSNPPKMPFHIGCNCDLRLEF